MKLSIATLACLAQIVLAGIIFPPPSGSTTSTLICSTTVTHCGKTCPAFPTSTVSSKSTVTVLTTITPTKTLIHIGGPVSTKTTSITSTVTTQLTITETYQAKVTPISDTLKGGSKKRSQIEARQNDTNSLGAIARLILLYRKLLGLLGYKRVTICTNYISIEYVSTKTSTGTTTFTQYVPGPTAYPQCSTANQASYFMKKPIVDVAMVKGGSGNEVIGSGIAASAAACCIRCLQAADCSSYYYDLSDKTCYFIQPLKPGVCKISAALGKTQKLTAIYDDAQTGPPAQAIIGNGKCGNFVSAEPSSAGLPTPTPIAPSSAAATTEDMMTTEAAMTSEALMTTEAAMTSESDHTASSDMATATETMSM